MSLTDAISTPDEEVRGGWLVFQLGLKHDISGLRYILFYFSPVHEDASVRTQDV